MHPFSVILAVRPIAVLPFCKFSARHTFAAIEKAFSLGFCDPVVVLLR